MFPVTGVTVVPEARGAMLLALLYQLEQSQWWSQQQMRDRQFEQLNELLAHAAKQVPGYQSGLKEGGFRKGREADPESWLKVPILDRSFLQQHHASLQARIKPDGHRKPAEVTTSGSTGTPVTVVSTEVSRLMWQAFALRDHYWHHTDFTGKLASIRIFGDKVNARYPKGHPGADWGPPVNLLHETGPSASLTIHTPVHQQLDWLKRENPDRLITFPSNAAELARLSLEDGVELSHLSSVRLLSEVTDRHVRDLISEAWGATVTEGYSAQEVGHIALQCPEHPHLHVQAENLYVEVLDEQGRPCRPGEVGRVVVTTLNNYAMPLIRYAIGDYAEVGESCPCGRGLPVLKRVLGRVRNMLLTPEGDRCWPNLAAPFYRGIAPVVQHQIVQHSATEIEARLVVERKLTEEEESRLREKILERLGYPFSLRFNYPERLERSASGKFEEFLCLVA